MKEKIYLHINYWERNGELENLFKLAKMNGYNGVELRRYGKSAGLADEAYKEEVCRLRDKYPKIEITFGCPMEFMNENESVRKSEEEQAIAFFLWAEKEFGTKTFNAMTGTLTCAEYRKFEVNGSAMATENHYKWAATHLDAVGMAVKSKGIKLALESHNCFIHDLPDSINKLFGMMKTDNVGVNIDYGNIMVHKYGGSLENAIEKLKDRIFYAHMKNVIVVANDLYCTTLAEGMIDNFQFVNLLKKIGYKGVYCLEFPALGDHFSAARRDIEYFKTVLKSKWD
ncbi:MAG: sugar phosphate isomerase/epimerase [Elusimicrobia bacterium]|nr:sugar phosphate isomerase/epimerase [Elusimicrobiota bacterium]